MPPLMQKLTTIARKHALSIPFSGPRSMRRLLNPYRTVLEVGTGKGDGVWLINHDGKFVVTGLDLFRPYLSSLLTSSAPYTNLIQGDATILPFRSDSFDAVVGFEIIEHLERSEAELMVKEMERVAKHVVLLTTPSGEYRQRPESIADNPHQEHLSQWSVADFRSRGFRVVGAGLPTRIADDYGIFSPYRSWIVALRLMAQLIYGPVAFRIPRLAGDMICAKYVVPG